MEQLGPESVLMWDAHVPSGGLAHCTATLASAAAVALGRDGAPGPEALVAPALQTRDDGASLASCYSPHPPLCW